MILGERQAYTQTAPAVFFIIAPSYSSEGCCASRETTGLTHRRRLSGAVIYILAYHTLLHLVLCAKFSSAAKASHSTRCQCNCALCHFIYSIGIWYAQRLSQSLHHQLHVTQVAKTSSAFLTHVTLSSDRKPANVQLASPLTPSRSPYHSINTDTVGTRKSPYSTSRVNHLRPHGSSASNKQSIGVGVDW